MPITPATGETKAGGPPNLRPTNFTRPCLETKLKRAGGCSSEGECSWVPSPVLWGTRGERKYKEYIWLIKTLNISHYQHQPDEQWTLF